MARWVDIESAPWYAGLSEDQKIDVKRRFMQDISENNLISHGKRMEIFRRVNPTEFQYQPSQAADVSEGFLKGVQLHNPVSNAIRAVGTTMSEENMPATLFNPRTSPSVERAKWYSPTGIARGAGAVVGEGPLFLIPGAEIGTGAKVGTALASKVGPKAAPYLMEAGMGAVSGFTGGEGDIKERTKRAGENALMFAGTHGLWRGARHMWGKRAGAEAAEALGQTGKETYGEARRRLQGGSSRVREELMEMPASAEFLPNKTMQQVKQLLKNGASEEDVVRTLTGGSTGGKAKFPTINEKMARRAVHHMANQLRKQGMEISKAATKIGEQEAIEAAKRGAKDVALDRTFADNLVHQHKIDVSSAKRIEAYVKKQMAELNVGDRSITRSDVMQKIETYLEKHKLSRDQTNGILDEIKMRWPDNPVSKGIIGNPAGVVPPFQRQASWAASQTLGESEAAQVKNLVVGSGIQEIRTADDAVRVRDVLQGNFDRMRRGRISDAEMREKAEALGLKYEDVARAKPGDPVTGENIGATFQVMHKLGKEMEDLVHQSFIDPVSDVKRAAAFEAAQRFEIAVGAMFGKRAEAGRALRATTSFADLLRNPDIYFRNADESEFARGIIARYANLAEGMEQSPWKLFNYAKANPTKVKRGDIAFSIYMQALLSSPKTHVVNMLSNTATLLTRFGLEKPVEAMADYVITGGGTLAPRTKYFREIPAGWLGLYEGLKDARKVWSDIMRNPATYSAGKGKAGEGERMLFTHLGKIPTPGTALYAADQFFKTLIERATLRELAVKQALKDGKMGQQFYERVADYLLNPTGAMSSAARREADYLTFTKPLGRWGEVVMRARSKHPVMKILFPFIRTPVNIAKYGMERIPFSAPFLRRVGEGTKLTRAEAWSRQTLSGLIAAGIMIGAFDGKISGSGPRDKGQRSVLYKTGWKPYSIKVGDKWYGYGRLEPISTILGFAADMKEASEEVPLSDEKSTYFASKVAYSLSNLITNKTYTRTLMDIFDAVYEPDRYGDKIVQNLISSMVPSGIGAITAAKDPVIRDVNRDLAKPWKILQARWPWLSEDLPPKLDNFGDPIVRPGTALGRFLSPIVGSPTNHEPWVTELWRLRISVGKPTRGSGKSRLTDEEFRMVMESEGSALQQSLKKLVESDFYINAPGKTDQAQDNARAKMIQSVMQKARKSGKLTTLRELEPERIKEIYAAPDVSSRVPYGSAY